MTATRLSLAVVFMCATAWAETAPTLVTCKDGTTAKGGRGACRGHGGVDKTKAAGEEAAKAPEATAPAASVTCKDGTASKGGRGACRRHGGIDRTKAAGAVVPAPAPAPAAENARRPAPVPTPRAPAPGATEKVARSGKAATDDPTGALAKCKDGMYWHGTRHSGSCSRHGGVAEWLPGPS